MNTKVVRLANRNYNLPEDIVFLLNDLDAKDEEIERLRAALRLFACECVVEGTLCSFPDNCRNYIARAARGEEKTSDE
jgi:hypothetical protein